MTPSSAPPHLSPAPGTSCSQHCRPSPVSTAGCGSRTCDPLQAARIAKPTLRTERQSALLGKRFPLLLAATNSQTAVSCLEVTGVIESTSAEATEIHLAQRLRRFPSSPFLHQIVCNAVQQWDSEIQKGDLVPVPAPFPLVQSSSKQANIYIIIYIYTHGRVHAHTHTDRTERKGERLEEEMPTLQQHSTAELRPTEQHSSPLVLPVSAH